MNRLTIGLLASGILLVVSYLMLRPTFSQIADELHRTFGFDRIIVDVVMMPYRSSGALYLRCARFRTYYNESYHIKIVCYDRSLQTWIVTEELD